MIRKAKKEYYQQLIIDQSKDPKSMFAPISCLLGKEEPRKLPPGNMEELAAKFSDFFASKVDTIRTSINNEVDLGAHNILERSFADIRTDAEKELLPTELNYSTRASEKPLEQAKSVEFKMEDRHKECLQKNRSFLCSEISLSAVLLAKLSESGVITDEHVEKLQNSIRNDTMAAAVLHFLIELLPRRGPEAFNLFLEALIESQQKHVADHLKQCLSDVCPEDAGTFERLRSELQSYYKRKLASIHPMPWQQDIYLNLTDVFVERQLKLKTNYKGDERIVTMDDLFTPQQTKEIPRRLLIEGNPGIGKSTICQTLAHEWGKQSCGRHCGTLCVHSFDVLLFFNAGDFIDEESVAHAVQKHILPSDCRITTSELQGVIEAKNVLIIVDAFDEANAGNRTLDRLIKGDILRHKTLLVTSRFNFLQNKLSFFDSKFKVEGYDKEEQLQHVKRYAAHQNIASAPFESMLKEKSIRDLCSNPLNLTLLCLLREEDTQLMITRTALYTSIHRIIRRKAGERMHLTEAEVEESLLRPLYQFAFEAHQKNETVVREKDSKKVKNFQRICQVGYLTNEVIISRLQEEVRFQFTHKTFVEFLTAKHIAEMDREERLNWLQHLRYDNCYIWIKGLAIDDRFKVEQNDPILGFLFGLLEEESAELNQMASLVMEETHFSSEHHPISSLDSPCEAFHQLLRLIAELNNDVPQELADFICKRRPPLIKIYAGCSVSCMKGMLKLCNLRFQPPIPMNVYLGFSRDEEEKMSFVQKLIECKNIECSKIRIMPRNDTKLWNMVSEWRIGQANSVQQVSIDCGFIKANPCEEFSFGNHLSELELDEFKPSCFYLLEAALHKPLTSLQLIHCDELDDRCISLIHQLLRNQRLQRVQLTSSLWQPQHFGFFLADFAQMENLQSLEITLKNSTDEEMRSLESILKRNKLSELTIYSDYSGRLYSVLNDSFNSMSSLRELHLPRVDIIDFPNLRHLDLINFSLLRYSKLNDNWIAVLSDALRSWRNLQQLRIDFDSRVSDAECSLRELFEAIAGCHRLQILHFDHLEMGDSVVPSVCRMIESLKQLRIFTSIRQRDKSLTEEGFKQLEPIIKRNGLNIYMN
ncbi:hypothetical protein CAPTEDRAFT_214242 [Capitella teleta]|uniref:CARD domain-containing protein n=1 Tax=Capitella teleta TaxID=283909 RepID=R7VJD9_CAPTE|nr:hypothetical protein CAPTEDRAFT_214242 [Capitella teleta]|eukprot:ELU16471.1 hypothetical protein CAPTEDRAFT_214242 [Capitella teleta]